MAGIKAEIAGKILTLLGYDGTDFYNLLVDPAGHLQVDAVSSALPAGGATAANQVLPKEIEGWDGVAWHKLPMLWGFSDILHLIVFDPDSGGGNVQLNMTTVPEGEVWVIQSLQIRDRDTACSRVEMQIRNGGYQGTLLVDYAPVADRHTTLAGLWTLGEDDFIASYWDGVGLNDRIEAFAHGYKMKISE